MAGQALLVADDGAPVGLPTQALPRRHADPHQAAVRGFTEVMAALEEPATVDDLLRLVVAKARELVGVRRVSVWLRDDESGFFSGRVANAGQDFDAEMRKLTAGIAADGFTREIVSTMAPVVIRDVQRDPRPVRSTMAAYGIRAMLGVPMRLRGEAIGLLFFDNEDRPHPYSPQHQQTAVAFADLAAIALREHVTSSGLRAKLEAAGRQNWLLRRARKLEARLNDLLVNGAGLRSIAEFVAEATGKPAAICDTVLRSHGSAAPAESLTKRPRLLDVDLRSHPEVTEALEQVEHGQCSVIGPFPSAGMAHRHAVAPIELHGERWGYVVIMEHPTRHGALDLCVAQRTAAGVALELTMQGRAVAAEWDARASLARELIAGGPDAGGLARSAGYLGVSLEGDHVALLIRQGDEQSAATLEPSTLAAALAAGLDDSEVFGVATEAGVALFVDVPLGEPRRAAVARIKDGISNVCLQVGAGRPLIVGVSSVCRDVPGFAQAYREAREVIDCIRAMAVAQDQTSVLAADDLGAARLLLGRGDGPGVDRFLDDVVGPVLDGGESSVELLRTLQCFFDEGRSARRSSARLDVHENTIRYRLARFRALTGLDVSADANDQLSVHVALLILRLRGCEALAETAVEAGSV